VRARASDAGILGHALLSRTHLTAAELKRSCSQLDKNARALYSDTTQNH